MNQFISPHQNININISYNIGQQQKTPKAIFGKKISKIVKSTYKDSPQQFHKTLKKNIQHPPKQLQHKKNTKNTKCKKKSNNNLFTLLDQDIIPPRRLKTEGNYFKPQQNSINKKTHKHNQKSTSNKSNSQHTKSLNNPIFLSQNTKATKQKKHDHTNSHIKKQHYKNNKSCILYQTKKQPIIINDTQHIMSTATNGPTSIIKQQINQRKRINSANIITSNKFVNKLLDISVLTSQLGNSLHLRQDTPFTIKQKYHEHPHHRLTTNYLQNCMNSIDLRIIKKMQQDNNQLNTKPLKDMNIGAGLQLITYLNKIKRIPLQKLNQQAKIIQQFWKRKSQSSIIPYYRNLFQNNPAICLKNQNLHHFNDISGIDLKQQISDHFQSSVKSPQSSNKNQQNNDFLQLVFNNAPSPKNDIEHECISTQKINKMFQVYSTIKNNKLIKSNEIQHQEKDLNKQISNNKNQIPVQPIPNIQQNNNQQPPSEDNSYNNKTKYRNTNKSKPSTEKTNAPQTKYQQIISLPFKSSSTQHPHPQQQKPAIPSTNIGDKNSRQSKHWNYVHNILSSNMNKKAQLMPENVLQQLIKQSAYNKQWVQGQFSNSQSLKISQKISPRDLQYHDELLLFKQKNKQQLNHKQPFILKANDQLKFNSLIQSSNLNNINQQQPLNEFNQLTLQANKIYEEQDDYNWNKYSDISRLKNKPLPFKSDTKQYKDNLIQKNIQYPLNSNNTNNKRQNQQFQIPNQQVVVTLLPQKLQKSIIPDSQPQNLPQLPKKQPNSQPQNPPSDPLPTHYQKYSHNKTNQMQDILQDIQIKSLSQDHQHPTTQINTQPNIIDNYLQCGLDNFQLYLKKNNNKNIMRYEHADQQLSQQLIQKKLETEVEEKQQHKAKLEKQHRFFPHPQPTKQLQPPKQLEQPKETTNPPISQINSIQNEPLQKQPNNSNHNNSYNQDKQLQQVFKTLNSKIIDKQQLNSNNPLKNPLLPYQNIQNALKNNKRNDTGNHLGFRPTDHLQSNQKISQQLNINQDKELTLPLTHNYHQTPKPTSIPQWEKLQQIPLFQPSYKTKVDISQQTFKHKSCRQIDISAQQQAIQQQLNNKRVQKIAQNIIQHLIQQFAFDVSVILRKTQSQGSITNLDHSKQQLKKNNHHLNGLQNNSQSNNLASMLGIRTNFQYIRQFMTKLKKFIIQNPQYSMKVIQNLKNNIGPTSVEILTYLRIQQPQQLQQNINGQPQDQNNQQWLFVIPNDLFQIFNKQILDEQETIRKKKLTNKLKLYMEFWHRSIFQCYNQCLDFQRPYGILGAPYTWITEPKLPHEIKYSKQKVKQVLDNAQGRLLQLSCSSSGIIFDKSQSPYRQFNLNQQSKIQLNQQKISRMLANQILDDQYNWISYNDQITQLMVDISRKIQELLVFQVSSDVKKISKKRKMMLHLTKSSNNNEEGKENGEKQCKLDEDDDDVDQHATFLIQDLT